jgi:hypothetical protein
MKHQTQLSLFIALLFSTFSTLTYAQVINELYVGGGNPDATYTNDAVILKGTAGASLSGWSLQYTSAAGTA